MFCVSKFCGPANSHIYPQNKIQNCSIWRKTVQSGNTDPQSTSTHHPQGADVTHPEAPPHHSYSERTLPCPRLPGSSCAISHATSTWPLSLLIFPPSYWHQDASHYHLLPRLLVQGHLSPWISQLSPSFLFLLSSLRSSPHRHCRPLIGSEWSRKSFLIYYDNLLSKAVTILQWSLPSYATSPGYQSNTSSFPAHNTLQVSITPSLTPMFLFPDI